MPRKKKSKLLGYTVWYRQMETVDGKIRDVGEWKCSSDSVNRLWHKPFESVAKARFWARSQIMTSHYEWSVQIVAVLEDAEDVENDRDWALGIARMMIGIGDSQE